MTHDAIFSLAGCSKLEVGILLSARLLFPKKQDASLREMYIISCVLDLITWAEAGEKGGLFEPESESSTEHSAFFYHFLHKIGGWKTLRRHFTERQSKSLRTEVSVRIENAFIAGSCLRQALEKQTSIQKVASVMTEKHNDHGNTPVEFDGHDCIPMRPSIESENITVNVWRTFKYVAHYWAAMTHYSLMTLENGYSFFLFSNLVLNDDPTRKHCLQDFLNLADDYRLRGTTFRPFRAVNHLLDATHTLVVTT